jgi:hypothetical protein
MTDGPHLTSEEVAAYVDDTLSDAECARVKAHLADCGTCRREIVSVARLIQRAPRSKRSVVAFSAIAAAAAIVVIVVARPSADSAFTAGGSARGAGTPGASEGVNAVRAIAPIGRQSTSDNILFVWHPAPSGAEYRLTLTDDRGGKLWTGSTNDTTLRIPKGAVSLPGGGYHWYVDVLQNDGGTATTGIESFQISR